jgi:hypothetical protein
MGFSGFLGNSSSEKKSGFSQYLPSTGGSDIDQQIQNATTRVNDAGYGAENTDKRNWLEKSLNVSKGQNWLFDTLEVLGRPQQALYGAVSALGHNTNVGEGVLKGLTGKQRIYGSDFMDDLGVKNKYAKAILGTGLDIIADPVNLIPGAIVAKGLKAGVGAGKAVAGTAYKAAEKAIPSFGMVSENSLRPAAESVKDGLGYMFKTGYKKDETLLGEKDDFLTNLERGTENSRKFMKENYMTGLADTAKLAGGIEKGSEVGRLMEKDLVVNGPRPFKNLSTDPNIVNAAQKLIDSNADIRNFALEKGIEIPELAGYMTHILTQEERARKSAGKAFKLDAGRFGTGNPNSKILGKRKYEGSAEEINQQAGREIFNPNAFFSTGVGQQRLIDYVHSVDFRRQVLSNPKFAQKFEKGMDIGKNVVIDSNAYKFLKESDDTLDGLGLADKVSGQYVVTPQVKMTLDRFQKLNSDEGTKAFMKAFDGLTGMWKKMALFSPGFHVRNMAGAAWNNYLAGMSPVQLGKYTAQGAKEVANSLRGQESAIFKEYRSQGLGSTGLTQVEFGGMRNPEKGIENTVKNRSKTKAGKIKQRLNPVNAFKTSREAGDIADQTNRFALYKFQRDKGLSPKDAAEKVREAQFDYSDLTAFEQNAKRLLPFYTWSRKNIPYQVKKFIEDPRKFQNINKLRLNAQNTVGLNEETMPDYMKENFWMPLSGKEGKGKMLSLNLPLGDLTKLSNPLKLGADSLTPLIKTPMELATNYNFFKGKPIQQFEGQEKKFIGGAGIPIKTAYALEQLTGQVGRGFSEYLQKPDNIDQDNKFRTPSMGINSFVKDFDSGKFAQYKKMDELKKLQDLIRYIEQQDGVKPRTLREIKKGSK